MRRFIIIFAMLLGVHSLSAGELVWQDKKGIIRWKADNSEVALFGANYCLPSACDYRAAGMVGGDRKKMIEQDMAHFTRMGWDGLRLSFWGDWENSDKQGNLIGNDHLDLLDYLISAASERGIMMLLSPIVTYNANWPDKTQVKDMPGFSAHFPKADLITDPALIEAQKNYITQLLSHTNPYTGRKLKDEPNILFVEIINEPAQHTDKIKESAAYMNAMYDAIRKTGCRKPVFYNISQDFGIAPAIRASKVDGATYAWYPTQLNSGYSLQGNYLPYVGSYPQIAGVDIGARARLVYEFDAPDVTGAYLYPAMVREYRKGGVQFAALFSYDMLATAPYNLGWQTHNFNMVCTPQKSISAIIAARAMKELPRGGDYGEYPANSRFGGFTVDHTHNLSLFNDGESLMYTDNIPDGTDVDISNIRNVVGYGSSPAVEYDGMGVYFLDRIRDGLWRLELYPDAVGVSDPFMMPNPDKICYELFHKEHSMRINLPDLSAGFRLSGLGEALDRPVSGSFRITPGVYLLSSDGDISGLPEKVNGVGLREYVVPENVPRDRRYLIHEPAFEYAASGDAAVSCSVYSDREPDSVAVYIRLNKGRFREHAMERTGPCDYRFVIEDASPALLEYIICVDYGDAKIMYPSGIEGTPYDWDFYRQRVYSAKVVPGAAPLKIFDAAADRDRMHFTRTFRNAPSRHYTAVDKTCGAVVMGLECKDISGKKEHAYPADVSGSYFIGDKIAGRAEAGLSPKNILLRARRTTPDTGRMILSFSQSDCAVWSAEAELTDDLGEIRIPVEDLKPGKAPMLPQDWPGVNPYWYPSPGSVSGGIDWGLVEKVFFSMREELYDTPQLPKGIEVKSVTLEY